MELAVEWGYEKVALWIIEQEGVEYLEDEERTRIVRLAIDNGQTKVVHAIRRASNANRPLAIADSSTSSRDGDSHLFDRCLRWFKPGSAQ